MKCIAWVTSWLLALILAACSGGPAAMPAAATAAQSEAQATAAPTARGAAPTHTPVPNPENIPGPFGARLAAILGQGVITRAAVSPDGQMLVIANGDGTVEWLDVKPGQVQGSLAFEGGAPVIVFSPDSRMFALVNSGNIQVVSREQGKVVASYTARHQPGIADVAFAGSGFLAVREAQINSYGGFGNLEVINLADGSQKHLPVSNRPEIFQFTPPAASPDGRLVMAGLTDGRVMVWDAASAELLMVLGGHNAPVSGVAFQPEGGLLASVDQKGRLRVRQVSDGAFVKEIKVTPGEELRLAFEDELHLLLISPRIETRRVDLNSGAIETVTPTYPAPSIVLYERYQAGAIRMGDEGLRLAFSPDGTRVAVVSAIVQIWDVQSGKVALVIGPGEGEQARAAAFNPDGSQLAVVYDNRAVRSFDAATGALLYELRGPSQTGWPVYDIIYSPDGVDVAVSDGVNTEVFDAISGKSLVKIGSGSQAGYAARVAFSDDSRTLFAVMSQGSLEMWNVAGSRIQRREGIATSNQDGRLERGVGWRWPWLAHFSRDAGGGSWVEVYSLMTQKTQRLAAPADSGSLVLNQDGSLLFARMEGMLCAWQTESGKMIDCGTLAEGYGSGIAVNPQGDTVALVFGGQVVVWDIEAVVKK